MSSLGHLKGGDLEWIQFKRLCLPLTTESPRLPPLLLNYNCLSHSQTLLLCKTSTHHLAYT